MLIEMMRRKRRAERAKKRRVNLIKLRTMLANSPQFQQYVDSVDIPKAVQVESMIKLFRKFKVVNSQYEFINA